MASVDVILYHAGCMDGLAAAYLVWIRHGQSPSIVCLGIPPDGTVSLSDVTGKHVVAVDVVPSNYAAVAAAAATFWIFDHHVTNAQKLSGVPYAVFDMNRSATGLVWKTYHGDLEMPELLQAIQARDLWKATEDQFALCEALHYKRMVEPMSPVSPWKEFFLFQWGIPRQTELLDIGRVLRKQKAARVAAAVQGSVEYSVMVDSIPRQARFLNVSETDMISDVGSALMTTFPSCAFAVLWRYSHKDEKYFYSLRSTDAGVDVGNLCARIGGGGHRNAAGCESVSPPATLFLYTKASPA